MLQATHMYPNICNNEKMMGKEGSSPQVCVPIWSSQCRKRPCGNALTLFFLPNSSLQINVSENPFLSQGLQFLPNTLREGHWGLFCTARVIEIHRQKTVNAIPKVLAYSQVSFLQSFQRQ